MNDNFAPSHLAVVIILKLTRRDLYMERWKLLNIPSHIPAHFKYYKKQQK